MDTATGLAQLVGAQSIPVRHSSLAVSAVGTLYGLFDGLLATVDRSFGTITPLCHTGMLTPMAIALRSDFDTVTTGVTSGGLPPAWSLDQNFPNPFNPCTTIRYTLPKSVRVTLKIYSIVGQEVATLVDDIEEAGYRSAVWNAANAASGIYLCRLWAGDFVQTKKLDLLH